MTGGHGPIPVAARLIDLQNDEEVVVQQTVQVEFPNPLVVNVVVLNFRGIPLPHPGEYRFQIYAGGEYCGERRIVCREVEAGSGGVPNE